MIFSLMFERGYLITFLTKIVANKAIRNAPATTSQQIKTFSSVVDLDLFSGRTSQEYSYIWISLREIVTVYTAVITYTAAGMLFFEFVKMPSQLGVIILFLISNSLGTGVNPTEI